jgi:hypothetical protein
LTDNTQATPQKITLGKMRGSGVRGLLIYCADYKCSHWTRFSAEACERWPDEIRLSDIESQFVCKACGKKGADVRPGFDWDKPEKLPRGF